MESVRTAIGRIKDYLKEEKNEFTRMGLYMALNTLKNEITVKEGDETLKELGLDEDLEKYL